MGKSFWEKDRSEVGNDELMAYTLAKIKPFAWVRRKMYDMENIFHSPPVFCWRFSEEDEEIYSQLKDCLEIFKGNVKWIVYKGDGQNNQSSRNYTIEPKIIFDLRKTIGNDILPEILKDQYEKMILKAITDIEPLCKLIEKRFQVEMLKPYFPIIPRMQKSN
jgi:hypothetical protein